MIHCDPIQFLTLPIASRSSDYPDLKGSPLAAWMAILPVTPYLQLDRRHLDSDAPKIRPAQRGRVPKS